VSVLLGNSVTVLVNQCDPPVLLVDLDIKLGSDPNPINPSLAGVLPVAILGSESLDVFEVNGMTLSFGPNDARLAHRRGPHFEDVNGAEALVDGNGPLDPLDPKPVADRERRGAHKRRR
jgi:hypothetical protein